MTFNTLTRKAPMQRTAFKKPSVGMTGILRTASFDKSKKQKNKEKKTRLDKPSVFRSPEYLAAVRTLDCVSCGRFHSDTQASHSNQIRFGKGRGLRSSDATAMALCSFPAIGIPGCHETHDQGGKRKKAEWKALEHQWIVSTVRGLIAARKLTGSEETLTAVKAAFLNENSSATTFASEMEAAAVLYVSLIESGKLWVVK